MNFEPHNANQSFNEAHLDDQDDGPTNLIIASAAVITAIWFIGYIASHFTDQISFY